MKLKFNKDCWYRDDLLFRAGETYEVSEENGWARRWILRGAEVVAESPVVPEETLEKQEDAVETIEETATPKDKKSKSKQGSKKTAIDLL